MSYSNSLTNYIKDLKIQHYYLKKFYYNSCSEWLKMDIELCLNAIEKEIKSYEILIEKQKFKHDLELKNQLTIFDYLK